MGNPIYEAFKLVKKDIFTLKDRIEDNKQDIKDIKKTLDKIEESLEKNSNLAVLEKELAQRIDNSAELTEEKLIKEISKLKKRLTLLENDRDIPENLYDSEEIELEVPAIKNKKEKKEGKKKKGFFSKIIDFLAEEED